MNVSKIESGPVEVVASGTVIAFRSNPITITYGYPNGQLTMVLEFEGTGDREPRILTNAPQPDILQITFVNFDSPVGMGTTEPMQVGVLDNKPLFLHFRVYDLKGSDKTLHYTVYRGKEAMADE